ncbi:MAG: STAS domain-containing protein [Nitriliruptorales bacterium]|nr:STAS domain-containing protein [Nitriliruptorales bacterium]
MEQATITLDVRDGAEGVKIIDIDGDVTPASEQVLMDAFERASGNGTRAVVLDFSDLDYMNSGGIGLLVTLLVRAQRSKQKLLAYGLTDHYRQIFELTRLDDAIAIHDTEQSAVAAAN